MANAVLLKIVARELQEQGIQPTGLAFSVYCRQNNVTEAEVRGFLAEEGKSKLQRRREAVRAQDHLWRD